MSTHLCRCSRGNDRVCPAQQPLEKLIARLTKLGYKRWAHVVDARWAQPVGAVQQLRVTRRLRRDQVP